MDADDPHDLQRFVAAQAPLLAQVRAELAAGAKRSHWMWFVFPQLKALGRSATARHFGLASLEEAQAYWRHPVLGSRLKECVLLALGSGERDPHRLFGSPDDLKFRSCLTLFERATPDEPLFAAALAQFYGGERDPLTLKELPMPMDLHSPAFAAQAEIPAQYTCEGRDIAPPLTWQGVPQGTKSLALIVDDPDAPDPAKPQRTWVHWVAYDISPQSTGLPEGGALPNDARSGQNDWHKSGYGGPCPPIGRHRYFFKLYALDTTLGALPTPSKAGVEQAMQGHVLAQAQLIGTYQKKKKPQ